MKMPASTFRTCRRCGPISTVVLDSERHFKYQRDSNFIRMRPYGLADFCPRRHGRAGSQSRSTRAMITPFGTCQLPGISTSDLNAIAPEEEVPSLECPKL